MSQGWNRSHAPVKTAAKAKSPSWLKGLLAGIATVAIGIGIWFGISSDKKNDTEKAPSARGLIKEVQPAPAPKPAEPKPKKYAEMSREEKIQWFHDKYGDNVPDNMQAILYFLKNPPKQTFKSKKRYAYLNHRSERTIANLMSTVPGTLFIQQPTFDESFDKDFTNALVDKMDYKDDDTEEVRRIKEDVEATKKEIARICGEEGKRPSEVMNEYTKQLFELGQYQNDLEKEIAKVHENPDITDQEVEDYIKAANIMLKSKGLKEIGMPDMARRSIMLAHEEKMKIRRAERAAAKELEAKAKEQEK